MKSPINFYTDEVRMPHFQMKIVRKWIVDIAKLYKKRVGTINYKFCDDEQILAANKKYLNHDYYTDIITFDNSEGRVIAGDILISIDTVKSNAEELGVRIKDELYRVIIHGVLHLCGLSDKTEEDKANMRQAEDYALRKFRKMMMVVGMEKLKAKKERKEKSEQN